MVYDPLSPFAPARIRCLLVPHGLITKSRFFECVERLKRESVVRLGDVSPSKDSDDTAFVPESFPEGRVLYDFSTSRISSSNSSLVPFELFREDFLILAIGDGRIENRVGKRGQNEDDAVAVEYTRGVTSLKEEYSTALVHRLLLFDHEKTAGSLPTDVIPLPPQGKGNSTALKTAMADITASLLRELATLARSIQALPSIETPRAQANANSANDAGRHRSMRVDQSNGRESPAPDAARNPNRASMPAHLSYMSTQPGVLNRPLSSIGASATVSENDSNGTADRPASSADLESKSHGNRDRVSVSGFGSGSIGERVRNQSQSHISIVVGSIFLLAGKWRDAITEIVKGATTAKANGDYIWHAKAMDLLLVSLLMLAWAKIDFEIPPIMYPFGEKSASSKGRKKSLSFSAGSGSDGATGSPSHELALQNVHSMLRDLTYNILHLYSRAGEFNSVRVPQILFSEVVIRLAKLLVVTEGSGDKLTRDELTPLIDQTNAGNSSPMKVRTLSAYSKTEIANILYRAIPVSPSEEPLFVTERLHILAGVAGVLSILGLHRKKALVLREVATQLLPALIQSRKDSAAEQGLHPAASLSALDQNANASAEGRMQHNLTTSDSIQSVLKLVCEVYGVISPSRSRGNSSEHPQYDSPETIALRAFEGSNRRSFGNINLKADVLRTCINVCEALPDLDGVLRFSSDLLRTAGNGTAPGPGTVDALPSIPAEDQGRLTSNLGRALNAANQLGYHNLAAEYWDEFLVRDITLTREEARYTLPVMRNKEELHISSASTKGATQGPFIFDPYASKLSSGSEDSVLVVDEEARFLLLLQNLYEVDLEIEWIKFDCNEVEVESINRNVIIGPYRTQKVHLSCIPKTSGRIIVSGCIAKIRGCHPRRFPLFKSPWKLNPNVKMKRTGLVAAGLPSLISQQTEATTGDIEVSLLPKVSSFEATVIHAQPTLQVKSMSVSQSALMILDGERLPVNIVLKNAGKIPIDLALISLSDNTEEFLKAATKNKELAPSAVYEEEVNAYRYPALKLATDNVAHDLVIEPKCDETLQITAYGKLGLRHATIAIDYGHLGVPRSEVPDKFYTRQFTMDFDVTVVSSVGLVNNDILPINEDLPLALDSLRSKVNALDMPPALRYLLQSNSLPTSIDYCLLLLDFHNAWSDPIALELQPPVFESSKGSGSSMESVSIVIEPNTTSRLLLPCQKLLLPNSWAQVPSINPKHKRQYVVTTGAKADPELERSAREVFWYREELLNSLRAKWTVQGRRGYARTGDVDLRRLTLTPRMLDTLRLSEVDITLQIQTGAQRGKEQGGLSCTHFEAKRSDFVTLAVKLRSRLPHAIQPHLRILPALANQSYNVALDLGRRVAFNGILQRSLPLLPAGGEAEINIGMTFLARGSYEIGAIVEELRLPEVGKEDSAGGNRPRAATGDFKYDSLTARTTRQVWYAREACTVTVVDDDR